MIGSCTILPLCRSWCGRRCPCPPRHRLGSPLCSAAAVHDVHSVPVAAVHVAASPIAGVHVVASVPLRRLRTFVAVHVAGDAPSTPCGRCVQSRPATQPSWLSTSPRSRVSLATVRYFNGHVAAEVAVAAFHYSQGQRRRSDRLRPPPFPSLLSRTTNANNVPRYVAQGVPRYVAQDAVG